MPKINELGVILNPSGGDLIPIYSRSNSDAYSVSLDNLSDYTINKYTLSIKDNPVFSGVTSVEGLSITGSNRSITGDFTSDSTGVVFRSNANNSMSELRVAPTGTGSQSGVKCYSQADILNSSIFSMNALPTTLSLYSQVNGSGTLLPITIVMGATEVARFDTNGNVAIGTTPTASKLTVHNASGVFEFASPIANLGYAGYSIVNIGLRSDASPYWNADHTSHWAPPCLIQWAYRDVEKARIDSSGNLCIGTTTALEKLTVSGNATFNSVGGCYIGLLYNGTPRGYIGTANTIISGGAVTDVAFQTPSNIVFASGGSAEKARIDSSGNLLVTGAGGIGYGTGSGGSVTQATSKSTSVTLNKPCGQITMNGAALAASTSVEFQLNNSVISANDIVVVCAAGGVSDGVNYQCWAYPRGGNALVIIRNMTAGSLTEAVVLNFAVIKGAIA